MPKTESKTKPNLRKQKDGSYLIDSFSHTLTTYHLTRHQHGWECTCSGYRYNFGCKHIKYLIGVIK